MTSCYLADGPGRFLPQPATAGPWGSDSQHGGPPAALLARAVEGLADAGERVLGRLTMELLGPVPVAPLRLVAGVVRPGRSVVMCEATLYDEARDRDCARATAWLFPASAGGPEGSDGTWGFLNNELTVHVVRPPVGEWLCLDAETTLGGGSVGVASSAVYDRRGLVARSAQALLVAQRPST